MHLIISLTDELLALKSTPENIRKEDVSCFLLFTLDLLTLISHSVYEAQLIRRELIRLDPNEHYKQLYRFQTPVSRLYSMQGQPRQFKGIKQKSTLLV